MSAAREDLLAQLADQLRAAEATTRPIDALTSQVADLTLAEAYRVQAINVARRLADGEKLVGRKIGLTSKAMQDQLRVNEPDVGALVDTMVIAPDTDIDPGRFIAPRLEAEFAFRLHSDLDGPIDIDAVRASIGTVMLAAEIIDSRIRDWRIALIDTVADNASSAAAVFGPDVPATDELIDALPGLRADLLADGEVVAYGEGSAILGHPLEAVLWLARTLAATGDSLKAGDLVLAGAVHASVALRPRMTYTVRGDMLPAVSFRTN